MALRRVLPSRATPEKVPEGAATAVPEVKGITPRNTPAAPQTSVSPAPAPEKPSVQAQTAAPASALAAAATSAFSTLPTAASARVLEDSFIKPASITPPEVVATPAVSTPAWESLTKPEAPAVASPATPAFSAPAWEAETKATEAAAVEAATAKAIREAMPLPEPEPEAPVVKREWQAPESYASQESTTVPLPQPLELPAIESALPEPMPLPTMPTMPEPAPQRVEPVKAEPTTYATEQTPSRPDNSPNKRRVREKRPRDFSAMGAAPTDPAQRTSTGPLTSFASHVPVDTRPLDKVNDSLIATGVMAPRPLDSLTGSLPTGLAESTMPALAPLPEIKPAAPRLPEPAPLPPVIAMPDPAPERAPERTRERAPESTPAPIIPPTAPRAPEAAPEPLITPKPAGFNLGNAPSSVADILPPPQSDLPWTRPQGAAEWEIETPDTAHWQPEGGEGAAPAMPAAAHMPSPSADLYKPFGNGSASPMAGIPPRGNTHFTPELPGQRAKSGGSTPWLLIAVIVLAAGGAGAYFLRSGGNGKVQQQLATLTNGTPGQSQVASNGLLPPPANNGGFYTPATPLAPPADTTSSSAVVAFADVPDNQANQPIVANGDEPLPKDLNVFDRFKTEVQRIKAGDDTGGSATTAAQPIATATGAITPDKLQEELAAYRSALAQSGDPKSLTPTNFRKDPDGYMDGKPMQAQGTPTATDASGNLLPPPAGNAGVLPPPDLYTNNPKNLPIVNEPLANAPARVRTLADFPDIEPYTPEREKVEIPKNLKPKMAATDFPALEVLSFVPGKGIVAFADGREGVLLIGETLNGWELVNVSPDNAEFKAGQKSYQVSVDN